MGFWMFMTMSAFLVPVIMIIFGIVLVKNPPKSINGVYGYRTSMSRKSQETWDFAQNYCGKLWKRIGIIMLPMSIFFMVPVMGKSENTIGIWGGVVEILQCIVLVSAIIPVEIALRKQFDKDGNRIK